MVEAIWIQQLESHLFFQPQLLQNPVHRLALATVPDIVQLRIETGRVTHLERVPITAGILMGLQYDDLLA